MRAVVQEKPGGVPEVRQIPVPEPGAGELLIRVAASPVNPSDLSLLNGTYPSGHNYPLIPGLEGSGLVVSAGKGLIPRLRNGKRVSFTATAGHGGSWAEYIVTSAMHTVPLGNSGYTRGAMAIVNPLTALAFVHIARKGGHRAIVNNAAGSALGKMLTRLMAGEKIALVNIVRNQEQLKIMRELGSQYLLNSSDPSFENDLAALCEKLNATLLLDAVGGEMTTKMINAAPSGSTIMLYANLSESNFIADPRTILQKDKKITGFFLGNWTAARSITANLSDFRRVKQLIYTDLSTEVESTYTLEQVNEALESYRAKMTSGKVLLLPGSDMINP